jgi:surface antigen-like variable number repeat protein
MRCWRLQIARAGLICMFALASACAQDGGEPANAEAQESNACPTPSATDSSNEAHSLQISIAELNFDGELQLPLSDRAELATSLKQRAFRADSEGATGDLEERVRRAWQDRGYFKVRVRGDAHVLTASPGAERISFTAHIVEGAQYRLGAISFQHNRAITNVQALRTLFPISDGDIFSGQKIATGLEDLRKVYAQYGYINFTAVPDTRFNEDENLIDLDISVDEGQQSFISTINVIGVGESAGRALLQDVPIKPGQIYNGRLVGLFWKRHPELLPPDATPSSKTILRLDEKKSTVAVTFDLRRCPTE